MARLSQSIRFCTSADQTRIAFATTGQGTAVVRAAHFLTHLDFDLNSPVWAPWITELSEGHTLLRYDGRGCGLSDAARTPLSLDAWVSDLEAVVDAAGLERFALFGCSQGAAISLAYAARHPERVSCLVLLGGYARGPLQRNPTPEQRKQAQLMLDLIELGWGQDNPAFRQVFTSLFIPGGSAEQVSWFNELERLSCTPVHAAQMVAAFGQIDVCELAARVHCPTLVLHARGDARVPFEEGRHLAGVIPGARFVPLDSRNHVLLHGEPAFASCFAEIQDFLQTHHRAAAPRTAFPTLTPGERELLELLAHGLDNLQISAHLGLSEKTVRNKVSSVFAKLDADTRAQAIVRARDAGFGCAPLPR
ncbi:alpha/beta fold hydrolase [Hydrogenophaga sp. PBL-H3]|uniref:alpha/beta fold hydrolase n=1 Tax=Hydrogenophaga sp. PBL-H3 TaxID=434010 RepID=UPI00131F891B|nr:alpha/beta fold hydrolase [Hydrogenophaga sp. PBL-H3]QHE77259.1 alpha/beta fold hydrolase [Hydrogenophaga sp. PBL-H3]QHE81683.1 alpha/beta fold hydrolase [Hydrogenophaga sp. PBL-H3]